MSNQNSLNSNTNLKIVNSSTNASAVDNDLSTGNHSINSSTNQTSSSNSTNIQNLLNNSNQSNNLLEQNAKLSNSSGNQANSSTNLTNNISNTDQVLHDDLSILVDNITNSNDEQTESANKLTSDLFNHSTNQLNMTNLSTNKKTNYRPNDLLDAACLAITEDNPNLFNENFSIEITQSESDLNCELNEYVNNNILEHDLILEEVTDKTANENELIENLLMNEHQSKYSIAENKSKFNLNNLGSCQINNDTDILLPNSFNSHTNDNLSNSSKKKNLNTSNVHLSYLLQTKPQDLSSSTHLQKHLQRKLVTDDNFVFGYNCYDNTMSTGNTMQAWSGTNQTGQTWSSNVGSNVMNNNFMSHNSSMLTNNQMPPHHLQQSHHHNQNSNMVMQQSHPIMNQKQLSYQNQSAQQLNPNNTNSININSTNNLINTNGQPPPPIGQQQQFLNQPNGQPMNRSMYSNNNISMSNNMQMMMTNQSSMHTGQPIMDTPSANQQQLNNQGMIYNQQSVNQQMLPNQPNQMVINNNLNNNPNHLVMKQSNYSNQMISNNPPTQQPTPVPVTNNKSNYATTKRTNRKKQNKANANAPPVNNQLNQLNPSANDNYKYGPQSQPNMAMQPNMINNTAPINQQQPNSMIYHNNNPNLQNRLQGMQNSNNHVYNHNNQQNVHQMNNNYQPNNVQNMNSNYGMRMQESSAGQISNNGQMINQMMPNGMMADNSLQNQPIQTSAMNSNKQMISSSINNSFNPNMPNTPIQPYNNQMNNSSMNNGPINNSIARGPPVRSSPYPNPSQYMNQKRAFNTQTQQQQPQPNLYSNSQGQMMANTNSHSSSMPPMQQQMINNNSNSNNNYINNNVSPIYNNNGMMPNQQAQYAQQSMNAHPNNIHYNKQNQSSVNSAYMPSNNSVIASNGPANGPAYPANNSNSTMINNSNNSNMINHNNPMVMNNMQQQRNNAIRPNNQLNNQLNNQVNNQINNCNSGYPTPPHSNYQNNNNGNYSNYDNSNQNHSSNNVYNNNNGYNQIQQQSQVCNQTNNINNQCNTVTANNSNLTNRGYNQHSPIPGNPTPPLTPYPSSTGSVNSVSSINNNSNNSTNSQSSLQMSTLSDIKPQEARLNLHYVGGMVLEPFALENDLVTKKVFELKQSIYNQLMSKQDLELQFRSFIKEGNMVTNWPANVAISVNNHLIQIEQQKPLFLKKICRQGKNTLQITVPQCSCQHMFTMQVVNNTTVKSALQDILRKQIKPVEFSVTKIKQNFNNTNYNSNSNNSSSLNLTPSTPSSLDENGIEQTSFRLSLRCPITFKRIIIPARGNDCKHLQCFDLETFLKLNTDKSGWSCPICNLPIVLENLEVDQYIHNIINSNNLHDSDEIIIDSSANWKVANKTIMKDEQELHAYQSMNNCNQFNSTGSTKTNYSLAQNGPNSNTNNQQMEGLMQNSPYDYQSMNINQQKLELDPLAAIEKMNQHEFGSIGSRTPSTNSSSNNLMSSTSTPTGLQQADILNNNNQSPNTKQQMINKSPICSNNNTNQSSINNSNSHSTANTPNSNYMINNSPHTPHTPHTPSLINHNSLGNLGPSSVISNHSTNNSNLNDLNFDPAIIDSETGPESLNDLLPDEDALDILKYLEPDNNENSATNTNINVAADSNFAVDYKLFEN